MMDTLQELINEAEKWHGNRHELPPVLKRIMANRRAFHLAHGDLHEPFSNALFKSLLLELDEEEEESIETAEIAYIHIGYSLRKAAKPELIKLRLLLLHYFSDYFTDAIIAIFLEKYRKDNLLEARNLALECLNHMQLTDMLRLESDFQEFMDADEQLQDVCNDMEMPDDFSATQAKEAELMHQVLHAYLHNKYKG